MAAKSQPDKRRNRKWILFSFNVDLDSPLGITAENPELLYKLVRQAAIEGEVVQQDTTAFGQMFKVDWIVPEKEGVKLCTTWEIATGSIYPRLITAFIKR